MSGLGRILGAAGGAALACGVLLAAPAEAQPRGAGVVGVAPAGAGVGRPGPGVRFRADRGVGRGDGLRGRHGWRGAPRGRFAYLWPYGYGSPLAYGPGLYGGWGAVPYAPVIAAPVAPSPPVLAGGAVTLVPITSAARTPGRPLLLEITEADAAPLGRRPHGARAQLQRSAWRDANPGPRVLTASGAGASAVDADGVGPRIVTVRPRERR